MVRNWLFNDVFFGCVGGEEFVVFILENCDCSVYMLFDDLCCEVENVVI